MPDGSRALPSTPGADPSICGQKVAPRVEEAPAAKGVDRRLGLPHRQPSA